MDLEVYAAGWRTAATVSTIACLILAISLYHYRATSWRVVPANIPWFFSDPSKKPSAAPWSAQVGAHLRDFSQGISFVREGYEKFSKHSKPFQTPSFTSWQSTVLLPASQLRWLLEQPDSVLSIDKCLIKDLEFLHTTPHAWSFTRPFHVEAINKVRLEPLIPGIAEEVADAIDREWGTNSEEWKEVNIEETMRRVLVRVTARIFVGAPLCHNEAYLSAAHEWIANLGPTAIFISLTPELLRPLAGWFFSRNLKRWNAECARYTQPLVEAEIAGSADQESLPLLPKTLLQQLARLAVRSGDARDSDGFSISSRLLALNFVAVHTSNAALVNCLVDILSPPASDEGVFGELRAEAETVAKTLATDKEGKPQWNKAAVLQLEKIDSALRESLRFSTFKARGLERMVVKEGGVVLPDGTFLPKNTKVGVPVLAMHRDGAIYPDADRFDALRFYTRPPTSKPAAAEQPRAEAGAPSHPKQQPQPPLQRPATPPQPHSTLSRPAPPPPSTPPPATLPTQNLINTSETFLAFGHGKHGCPGRFMAAFELKLALAYLVSQYDVQSFDRRPENAEFSDFSVGSFHCLRVRRRGKVGGGGEDGKGGSERECERV
ncbi:hypothetical protein LTR08_001182 [Meristemomyces frigidus]|nr:hypothetical protein LTR08_001182 [Meristemomyces frigidus]